MNVDCNQSLLNADYKILAKALAIRLETVIHQIISDDQSGFISNRHSFSYINNLANVTPEMQLPFHKCNSELKYLENMNIYMIGFFLHY